MSCVAIAATRADVWPLAARSIGGYLKPMLEKQAEPAE